MKGKKKSMEWKLGYLPLWWMRMSREGRIQQEQKSLKTLQKSMKTFTQNIREEPVEKPDYLRTTPAEMDIKSDDEIKGRPVTSLLSVKTKSLAIKLTPGKGTKRTFMGDNYNYSPAKIHKECPSIYQASQNTQHALLTEKVKTKNRKLSQQDPIITDDQLMSFASITVPDSVNISTEEREICSDDHSY